MKKIDFGQAVGILANIGVVAGIVFLAIQVRQNSSQIEQNTVAAAAQAVFQLNQEANSIHQNLYEDVSVWCLD